MDQDNGNGAGQHIRDVLFEQVTQLIQEREKGFAERFGALDTTIKTGLASLEKASNVGLMALEKMVMMGFDMRDHNVEVALVSQDKRVNDAFDARDKAVNAALSAAKEAVNAALSAAKEAVTKAETASAIRFESVNEFRQTLTDQTQTFIPRLEVDQRLTAIDKTIDLIAKQQAATQGRAQGLNAGWAFLVGGIGIVVALVSVILAVVKSTS